MAITFDNTTTATNPASDTLSFTTTGTNRYLVVGMLIQSSQTVTGVTYNGVAMTQIVSVSSANVSGGETIYLFGLANPASGANNIVGSFSGAGTRIFYATSFAGAQQTTASEASNSGTGASGTATVSVTTTSDNAWLVGLARGQSNVSASTNTTLRGALTNQNIMDSNAAQTPAGSHSLNFTTASNNNWASLVMTVAPSAVTANGNFLAFF